MTHTYHTIGLIGGGNMGEAIVGALIHSGQFPPERIRVSDVLAEKRENLAKTFGVGVTTDNPGLFRDCDIVVLAIKPQQMETVLSDIVRMEAYGTFRRKLILSIAAGITIRSIETLLYGPLDETARKEMPVIRVMPNTPALVLAGISGMSPNRYAADADVETATSILSAMGRVVMFEEKDLDAVTAVSGSGPAYVFYLIEAMIRAGIEVGLSPEKAAVLTVATVDGAVRLLQARNESPESLRKKVTSPGGTTEAAIAVLEKNHVKRHICDAIRAAAERGRELSR